LTPFLGTLSPGPKLFFFLPKKIIQCGKNREIDKSTDHAVREVTKRSLESGAPGDAIIVENFWKKDRVSNDRTFKIVRTRDEVDMQ
jgi:hypothetical protein